MSFTTEELAQFNLQLRNESPLVIARWAIHKATKPVVTTNFRPYEAAILHVCVAAQKNIPVIWCDSGYNTPQTYTHASQLIKQLELNVDTYVPNHTAAYRDTYLGIPDINDPKHEQFTKEVKLEPFSRAMRTHEPDVWFTNLRQGQTDHRNSLDILSQSKDGVLKVSPFFYYSDADLDVYLTKNGLPNEFTYFDPTKVLGNRECGLHV